MPEILICDDDATTRKMLRGILKSGGMTVSTAADGQAALRALRKKKFDIVLLDIWMPKISASFSRSSAIFTRKAAPS